MHADHELFHARHHLRRRPGEPSSASDDRELEAWTDGFVRYFHRIYRTRKRWKPLIDAYEGVQEQSRRHGYLLRLLGMKQVAVGYFSSQPDPVRIALFDLLERRRRDMPERELVGELARRWR